MVRRLRTSVGIELAIGVVVLAVAAVLVAQAPARSTYIKPVDKTVALASGGKAEVEMTPAKVGQNTLTVKVFDRSGKQVDARAVTATEALPADQYGPLDIQMRKTGTGQYSSSAVSLTKTGSWELVVRVQMSEFDRDVVQVDVKVT
jgi:copper transport protein